MTDDFTLITPPTTLSIAQVQAALQRCMSAEPVQDFALSRDASLLTDVFASMRFFGAVDQGIQELSEKHQSALSRWLDAEGEAGGL
jgi:hypothetical protein